ncbi:serine/threonine-protein kinase [Streptomyces sp. MS06]|uniref:serine/threonine-protein kinase n=1 Tax=Streptomyces sp. MS06 TaxID=3385974 RepID=UPI0039A09357
MTPQRDGGADTEAERPEYAGHYRLESCLGSGGMGVVHLAASTSGRRLAVKVVHAEFARDPEFRGRFRQEVAAARRVSGAFTASVVDADPEADRPWMATLFIPGPTLAEAVKRNGPMAPAQVRRLMAGLAEALRDIHRVGVVHRDLKPSNVLLGEDGPKVIDFGISRPTDSELRTETGKLIGTPPFMAPEQFRRPREVGPAADVFALGSVIVHAATGRGPFDSDSPYLVAYQVVHDEPDLTGVPGNLAPLVVRCLAKEPEDRPTPDELMRELRSLAASYDTQAFVPSQRSGDRPDSGTGNAPGTGSVSGTGNTPGTGSASGTGAGTASGGRAPGRWGGQRAARGKRLPRLPVRTSRARPVLVAAVALAVVAGTAFASVRLLGAGSGTERPESTRQGTSARFGGWQTGPGSGGNSAPRCSYGAGRLLCARSGQVFALDPSDGSTLWRHPVPAAYGSRPPALAGGLVQPPADPGGRLEALDPRTGEPRWQRARPASAGTVQPAGGMLLLTGADGTVTGVDGATGDTAWHRRIPGQARPRFTAFPGDPLAYAATASADGSSTRVTAVDPATGEVRRDGRLRGDLTPVGVSGGALLLLATDVTTPDVRAVVRYDPRTGATRRVDLPFPLADARAAVRGDEVWLLGANGSLQAVDTGGRGLLWRLETSVLRGSAPVVDGGHVYFTGADGRLLAVDAGTGRLLGQTRPRMSSSPDRVSAGLPAPVVAGGRVYAAAPDGTVFAVDGRDPARW